MPSKQIDGNDKNTQNEQITKNARTETCLPVAVFAYSCKGWGHVSATALRWDLILDDCMKTAQDEWKIASEFNIRSV